MNFVLGMLLEKSLRRVAGDVLIKLSPSNISQNLLLLEGFQQNCHKYKSMIQIVSLNTFVIRAKAYFN